MIPVTCIGSDVTTQDVAAAVVTSQCQLMSWVNNIWLIRNFCKLNVGVLKIL